MPYYSTKTYGHNIGLSAVFRQPKADHSHCHLLHGYSLAFKFTFGCKDLDDKNWAVDFGGLKELKQWLEEQFDHKTVIDSEDPHMEDFYELEKKGRQALHAKEISIYDPADNLKKKYTTNLPSDLISLKEFLKSL